MFDYDYELKDTGRVEASGYGSVDGSAKVINVGSGLIRANAIIDVFQIAVANSDLKYVLHILGGSDSDFTIEESLASLEIGNKNALEGNVTHSPSRFTLPFQNEKAGTIFPYLRIRHVLSGTSPSLNYQARLEKDLPVTGSTNIDTISTTTTTT